MSDLERIYLGNIMKCLLAVTFTVLLVIHQCKSKALATNITENSLLATSTVKGHKNDTSEDNTDDNDTSTENTDENDTFKENTEDVPVVVVKTKVIVNQSSLDKLSRFLANHTEVDVWHRPNLVVSKDQNETKAEPEEEDENEAEEEDELEEGVAEFAVPEKSLRAVEQELKKDNIKFEETEEPLKMPETNQDYSDDGDANETNEDQENCHRNLKNATDLKCVHDFNSHYHSFQQIMDAMELIAKSSERNVKILDIGMTHEGRPLKVLNIQNEGKPHVYIQSGLHAREHIALAVGVFLMYNYAIYSQLGKEFNFHLMTVANPDGYEYSRIHDRVWRKNRARFNNASSNCVGTDLNRNFGHKWGVSGTELEDKCSSIYGGQAAFSENETKAVRDYLTGLSKDFDLAIDIHSFGNKLLFPYGYEKDSYPENIEEIKELGRKAAKEIPGMSILNSAQLYPASGAADDWLKGSFGARFVYTFELPGYGQAFWPDEKHIWDTVVNTRNAINQMLYHLRASKKHSPSVSNDPPPITPGVDFSGKN